MPIADHRRGIYRFRLGSSMPLQGTIRFTDENGRDRTMRWAARPENCNGRLFHAMRWVALGVDMKCTAGSADTGCAVRDCQVLGGRKKKPEGR
jgi:lysyl-tRNA synthetase class I